MTSAQGDDAQRLASELRFGLGWDSELQVAAQRLRMRSSAQDRFGCAAPTRDVEAAAFERIVEPRWARVRIGKAPSGSIRRGDSSRVSNQLDVGDVEAGVPNTVIITLVLGELARGRS